MRRSDRLVALLVGTGGLFAANCASHADALYPVSYTTVGDQYAWDGYAGRGFGFIVAGATNTLDLSSQVQGGTWPGAPGPGGTWSNLPAPDWTKPVSSPVYDYEYYQVANNLNAPYVGWESLNPDLTFHFGGSTTVDSVSIVADSNPQFGVSTPTAAQLNVLDSGGNVVNSLNFDSLNWVAGPSTSGGTPSFSVTLDTPQLNLGSSDSLEVVLTRGDQWTLLNDLAFSGSESSAAAPLPPTAWVGGVLFTGLAASRLRKRRLVAWS